MELLPKCNNTDNACCAVRFVGSAAPDYSIFPLSSQISTLRRQGRTLFSTVPETAGKEAHSLFVQEVKLISTWTSACFVRSSTVSVSLQRLKLLFIFLLGAQPCLLSFHQAAAALLISQIPTKKDIKIQPRMSFYFFFFIRG